MPGAIVRGELHLDYQPIVSTSDGRVTGFEALLRWTHPTRGLVAPLLLIPLAEQSGQIVRSASGCSNKRGLSASGGTTRRSSKHESIGQRVGTSVHVRGLRGHGRDRAPERLADPSLLTLEVTESVFIRDYARATVVPRALKRMGVMLALDDFGTGYSSLTHLLNYPVDTIKVDRTFVARPRARRGQ